MNALDKVIDYIWPQAGYKRNAYRRANAAYEAAKPSRLRRDKADNRSGDAVVGMAGPALRGYARQLEQNYDIAKGALDVLVNNIVGPFGITREPQPRNQDGEIHEEFAKQLMTLWADWTLRPEVTWQHDYAATERLACRTWVRDGEVLTQLLEGVIPTLDHGTRVPFSLELIEADHLPFNYEDITKGIRQGVERDGWGRSIAFHIYKQHPGNASNTSNTPWILRPLVQRVSADRMLHIKIAQRIRQARGVSVFASVIRRLEDMKDYEESERIAARVAAALTGFIKKGTIEDYIAPGTDSDGNTKTDREISMKPGMIFDNLLPGEDIGTIDSNRPSKLLTPFHDTMTRFVAAGLGASYSSVSRNYNGTYSAQRQELVEGWGNYQGLTQWFVGQFSRPVWQRFVEMCIASGQIKMPRDLDPLTIYDADFRGPAMPWIDPVKEVTANKMLERSGYASAQQIIRARGGDPKATMDQILTWRTAANEKELIFETDPAHDKGATTTEAPAQPGASSLEDDEDEENDNAKKD